MRPRKNILLIDSDEMTQSSMRFLLEIKGYRVLSASTGEEALEFTASESISVMLLCDRGRSPQLSALALDLKRTSCAPLLFISHHLDPRADDPCYDVRHWERKSNTDLIEKVKTLAARKRGPKPVKPAMSPVLQILGAYEEFRQERIA